MGDTPAPRRSNRGRHPTPKNPMNAADPLFPDPPSDFESQRRSESARKGWEKRRGNRKNSATTPVNMSPAGSPQEKSSNKNRKQPTQRNQASRQLHTIAEEELNEDDDEQRSHSLVPFNKGGQRKRRPTVLPTNETSDDNTSDKDERIPPSREPPNGSDGIPANSVRNRNKTVNALSVPKKQSKWLEPAIVTGGQPKPKWRHAESNDRADSHNPSISGADRSSNSTGHSRLRGMSAHRDSRTSSRDAQSYSRLRSQDLSVTHSRTSSSLAGAPDSHFRDDSENLGYRQSRDVSLSTLRSQAPKSLRGKPHSRPRYVSPDGPFSNERGRSHHVASYSTNSGDEDLQPEKNRGQSRESRSQDTTHAAHVRPRQERQSTRTQSVTAHSRSSGHTNKKRRYSEALTDDEADSVDTGIRRAPKSTGQSVDQSDLEDDDSAAVKRAKKPRTIRPARATISSMLTSSDNLRAVFLHSRAMLGIYLLAEDPFSDNVKLAEVISGFTRDSWDENPHLKGTTFSSSELRTVIHDASMFRNAAKASAKNIVPISYGFHSFNVEKDTSTVYDIIQAALYKAAFVCSDWGDFIHTNKRSGFLENPAIKLVIGQLFRHEFLTSPPARRVAAREFYPLKSTTLAFAVTLIYHILQVYQSGEKIDVDFSRDNYLGKYKDFLNLINEWIERRGEKWDILSEGLGRVALDAMQIEDGPNRGTGRYTLLDTD